MNFIVDEGVPLTIVHALRSAGHDVVSILETSRGKNDELILQQAHESVGSSR